jgi:hypothetical protein
MASIPASLKWRSSRLSILLINSSTPYLGSLSNSKALVLAYYNFLIIE